MRLLSHRRPGYEQKRFSEAEKKNRLRVVASPDGRDGSVRIQQDAVLFGTILEKGQGVTHRLESRRYGWLQLVRGRVELNGETLEAGDGAALTDERRAAITALDDAEFLLFDLA